MNKTERLKLAIQREKPNSRLEPIDLSVIEKLKETYSALPGELIHLYSVVGTGTIGDSNYAIHFPPSPPDVIYDSTTAKELEGTLIVGDDFSGNCEAYDTKNGWIFGTIGSDCKFEPYDNFKGLVDFLLDWYEPKN